MATTPLRGGMGGAGEWIPPGKVSRVVPRASLADLGAEAAGRHRDFGAGSLIVCDRLVRIYVAAGIEVQALQGLDLLVAEGEIVALVGASGSGKSTLMNILAGLDSPTAGSVRVAGRDLAAMSARQRLAYRRRVVGFVWQQTSRNLLPYLTAQQNVELPMRLAGGGATAAGPPAAPARPSSCTCSASATACTARPTSCPAASSSGPPSRWRWSTSPRCCSPTSPPASSIRPPRPRCSARCSGRTPNSASPC